MDERDRTEEAEDEKDEDEPTASYSATFPSLKVDDGSEEPALPARVPQLSRVQPRINLPNSSLTNSDTFPSKKTELRAVSFGNASVDSIDSRGTFAPPPAINKERLEALDETLPSLHESEASSANDSSRRKSYETDNTTISKNSDMDGKVGKTYFVPSPTRDHLGGKGDAANMEYEEDQEDSLSWESETAKPEWISWLKHSLKSTSVQVMVTISVIGSVLLVIGVSSKAHFGSKVLRLDTREDVHLWQILQFAGVVLLSLFTSQCINWLVNYFVSFLATTRLWVLAMYFSALDGPLRDILFTSSLWRIWREFLPTFGSFRNNLLSLLSILTAANVLKELFLVAIESKVTKDQFKKALADTFNRMTTLQNVSVLAAAIYRCKVANPKAKYRQSGDKNKAEENSPGKHLQYSESTNTAAPVNVDGAQHIHLHLPNAALPQDFRRQVCKVDEIEGSFHLLGNEAKSGKFKLYNGKGELIEVSNASTARDVAASIFSRIDRKKKGVISVEDLANTRELGLSADDSVELLARMGYRVDRQITRRNFVMFAHKVYADYRSMGQTLKNYTSVTKAIKVSFNIAFAIAMLIIGLVVFDVSFMKILVPAATVFVIASFALGSTVNQFVQGLVFTLSVKPYCVGDRVRVNDSSPMFVHKIAVYYTAFKRFDGSTETHSNYSLAQSRIRNEVRSDFAIIEIPIRVGSRTTSLQLDKLTSAIIYWIRERRHVWKEDYIEFYIYDISAYEYMDIAFWFGHRFTLQHGGAVWGDISKLRLFIAETMCRLGMAYIKAAQPVFLGCREELAPSIPPCRSSEEQPKLPFMETPNPASNADVTNLPDAVGRRVSNGAPNPMAECRSFPAYTSAENAQHSRRESINSSFSGGSSDKAVAGGTLGGGIKQVGRPPFEIGSGGPQKALVSKSAVSERNDRVEKFDPEAHAKNFIDIRTGGVHHTWNWALPLRQRGKVFTSPELIEKLLHSGKGGQAESGFNEDILHGSGYGLSLRQRQKQQQQHGSRSSSTHTRTTSCGTNHSHGQKSAGRASPPGACATSGPESFGGLSLKK
eukprot:gb/GECG01001896.1/.p1 GENE.gb/GECG01001896.1/~~gb/GECG01001896.1/.p1  ORF type:complete len:1052 (+),score=126.25 gb/GECG01001896.1/:1-3156(+)